MGRYDETRRQHHAVVAARGKASDHDCVCCGRPARDWAFDHRDPAGPVRVENGRSFSLCIDDYMPMCRPCHMAFDGRKQAHVVRIMEMRAS